MWFEFCASAFASIFVVASLFLLPIVSAMNTGSESSGDSPVFSSMAGTAAAAAAAAAAASAAAVVRRRPQRPPDRIVEEPSQVAGGSAAMSKSYKELPNAAEVGRATAALRCSLFAVAPSVMSTKSVDTSRPAIQQEMNFAAASIRAVIDSLKGLSSEDRTSMWTATAAAAARPVASPSAAEGCVDECHSAGGDGAQGVEEAENMRRSLHASAPANGTEKKIRTFGDDPEMRLRASTFAFRTLSALGHPYAMLTEVGALCDECAKESAGVVCGCRSMSSDRLCFLCDRERHMMLPCSRRWVLAHNNGHSVVKTLRPNEFVEPQCSSAADTSNPTSADSEAAEGLLVVDAAKKRGIIRQRGKPL
jgi:hypothetical protein